VPVIQHFYPNSPVLPLLGALAFALPTAGSAQQLEEVLVTAAMRSGSLLDKSSSISVISGDDILQRGAEHLEQVLNLAPNVNSASGASRARFYQIRGVGERSQFQEPVNPSTGLLIDGIDFSGLGSAATLFDVEQIEILRGPQGTLHGANALGGLMSIRTAAPTDTPWHRAELTAAEYQSMALGFVSSGPLASDQLLYRLAMHSYQSDGFIDNDYLQKSDTNNRDENSLRLRLRWIASANNQLDISVQHLDIDNGYDAFSLDNTRHTLSDQPGQDRLQSTAAGLFYESRQTNFSLQARGSLARSKSAYGYDEDWSFPALHPWSYSSSDRYLRDRDSLSAELRLLSNDEHGLWQGRSAWVIGAYFLANREDLRRQYTYLPKQFSSAYDSDTLALFGQLDTSINDHWKLITGLRVENRATHYTDVNDVSSKPNKTLWGGRLVLEYQAKEHLMWYGGLSRGYRAHGINAAILASINSTEDNSQREQLMRLGHYDEESLINYEAGMKARFADGSAELRVALFYMDRRDQQVRGSYVIPREDNSSTFIDYTNNAAGGSNYGSEIEFSWLPNSQLLLYANLGLLQTELEDYINADGEDLSGRDQAQAPHYQYALGGRWDFQPGFFVRLDVEGKADFLFSDRHSVGAPAFNLLHARVGYESERWALSLWGRNLTDKDYFVRGFGSFGNDPRKGYITEPYYQFGEPRVVGVTASYSF